MEKNNKLIVEFMGCTNPFNEIHDATLYKVEQGTFELDELQYHTSWDWLMPVIEEIDHTSYDPIESIEDGIATRSLEMTYKAVVESIKTYNDENY